MTTNSSRVKIAGHPLHAMLVAFPITFYTSTLVAFIVYAVNHNPFWWTVALFANCAGVLMAALAAAPGFIDWWRGIPAGTPAKSTGLVHMALNVSALTLFIANLIVHRDRWVAVDPSPTAALALTGLGVFLTLCAGALGWRLVQTHHVGVNLTDEQARAEPVGPVVPAKTAAATT